MRRRPGDKTALGGYGPALRSAADKLHETMLRMHPQPFLSENQFLQMVAPMEHVGVLLAARDIGLISKYALQDTVEMVLPGHPITVSFSMSGTDHPVLPRKPEVQDPQDPKFVEILEWAHEWVEMKFKWGLVYRLIEVLNKKFSSPAQFRYAWPAVLGLMRTSTSFSDLLPAIEEFKRPNNMPYMSPELAAVCQECSQIVSTGLIMRDLVAEEQVYPVAMAVLISGQTRLHTTCAEIGSYYPAQ
jgi:hypothetical protein